MPTVTLEVGIQQDQRLRRRPRKPSHSPLHVHTPIRITNNKTLASDIALTSSSRSFE
jgi:hypothetical protein